MKRKRYTEEQIAFALRQAESGTPVAEIIRKMDFWRSLTHAAPPCNSFLLDFPRRHGLVGLRMSSSTVIDQVIELGLGSLDDPPPSAAADLSCCDLTTAIPPVDSLNRAVTRRRLSLLN